MTQSNVRPVHRVRMVFIGDALHATRSAKGLLLGTHHKQVIVAGLLRDYYVQSNKNVHPSCAAHQDARNTNKQSNKCGWLLCDRASFACEASRRAQDGSPIKT